MGDQHDHENKLLETVDVNNEPKARVMTGGPSVHKAAASNPAEPEKRKLSSRQRMVWDDFTPPTSSNPEPPTPIPPSSASGVNHTIFLCWKAAYVKVEALDPELNNCHL